MEAVILLLVIIIAAIGITAIMFYARVISYKNNLGCPISEDDLDQEIYIVIGINSRDNKVYYLLKSGSKILTCWRNEKEDFKNFDYSSEEMRLIPKNNS